MSEHTATIGQALLDVAELINKPERWTKRFAARDALGQACNPLSPDATCWCLIGACHKVTINTDLLGYDVADRLRAFLPEDLDNFNLGAFNDNHDHEQVLALVLEAAEATP